QITPPEISLALSSRRDHHHHAATAKIARLIVAAFPSRLSRYRPPPDGGSTGGGSGSFGTSVSSIAISASLGVALSCSVGPRSPSSLKGSGTQFAPRIAIAIRSAGARA
ncbi:MAG: hypothetical protein ACLQF1_12710, partial [Methyloceanibacter sp.]